MLMPKGHITFGSCLMLKFFFSLEVKIADGVRLSLQKKMIKLHALKNIWEDLYIFRGLSLSSGATLSALESLIRGLITVTYLGNQLST
jgi:hypothetical protein